MKPIADCPLCGASQMIQPEQWDEYQNKEKVIRQATLEELEATLVERKESSWSLDNGIYDDAYNDAIRYVKEKIQELKSNK